jgi:hypothetical protein
MDVANTACTHSKQQADGMADDTLPAQLQQMAELGVMQLRAVVAPARPE